MASKPIIISVVNQKGGVGKTTTTVNLAASMAKAKKMVLVIDADYQSNTTTLLIGDKKQDQQSITYAIKNDLSLDKVVMGTLYKNIDLVSANRELDDLREQIMGQPNQFRLVDLMLDCPLTTKYDFIFIDTHPSLDCFFQSSIAASNYYIIPMFPEADSSRGLAHQIVAIEKIKKYLNPKLAFLGCMIVKYDKYNATHQKFEKLIREYAQENSLPIFKTNIPNSQSVAAAAACGLPLLYYKPKSFVSEAYMKIAKEVLMLTNASTLKKSPVLSDEIEVAAEI